MYRSRNNWIKEENNPEVFRYKEKISKFNAPVHPK
jgi:hypothetical protein